MKADASCPWRLLLLLGLFAGGPSPCGGQDSRPETVPLAPPSDGPRLFSFRADGVPMKQALALFARANRLNIVPDLDIEGEVTVEFQELPLDLAMRALLEANGYYATTEGPLIRVRGTETRLFSIDYINMTRSGQGSNAVQISSGGSGTGTSGASASASGTEGSSMTVTASASTDFWGGLGAQLKAMLSEGGTVSVNSLAGTVVVTDTHTRVNAVAQFLESVTQSVVRQVELEVQIYEVAFTDSLQLGVDWQRLSQSIDSTFSTIAGSPGIISDLPDSVVAPLSEGGGLIVKTPVYGPAVSPAGLRIEHLRGHTAAIIEALKQQGTLKIVSKPRLRTLNNQPAVVRVGQDFPVFLRQVTQSPGDPPIITVNESVQNITVGTVLSITPQIAQSGLITLDISPAVSRLVRVATSASGDTNAPVIDIRQASSIVRLRNGDTVVMGGLVQESSATTRRKVPLLGDIPLLGRAFSGEYTYKENTELVFFLTPRIVSETAPAPAN